MWQAEAYQVRGYNLGLQILSEGTNEMSNFLRGVRLICFIVMPACAVVASFGAGLALVVVAAGAVQQIEGTP